MSAALQLSPDRYPDAQLILEASAKRSAWLATRKLGIGGSDVAALKGESNYGTGYTVWCDKTGRSDEKFQTIKMRRGQLFELAIATDYSEQYDVEVTPGPGLLQSLAYPHMLATPDFFLPDGGLEIKFVQSYGMAKKLLNGSFPESWWWQMLTYLAVTGAACWRLVAMLPGRDDLFVRKVEAFEVAPALDELGPFIEEWWTAHVVMDIAPDDGAPLIDGPLPLQLGDAVEAFVPDALLRDEARLVEIGRVKDSLEAEAAEIHERWLMEIGKHKYLTAGGRKVLQRVSSRTGGKFDRKALRAQFPDIEAQFSAPGRPYSYIKFIGQE